MNRNEIPGSRLRRGRFELSVVSLLVAGLAMCLPVVSSSARAADVDLNAPASAFPGADGVVLRWEQSWTLDKSGKVSRRDHQYFKLFNSRPIRHSADPRLDYQAEEDELIIHTARTHMANGQIVTVPNYSYNRVGPSDVAGWPAYLDWEQMVVSFSGIEANAVLELDYEVTTKPHVLPFLEADIRLAADYPVAERVVKVTVPAGMDLQHLMSNTDTDLKANITYGHDGTTTYVWNIPHQDACRSEAHSPAWQEVCGRLQFTTAPNATGWAGRYVDAATSAVKVTPEVKQFAEKAIQHERDPHEQVLKVAKSLQDEFNFIDSWKADRSLQVRAAGDVLRSNYGNVLESAAVLASAYRSLGFNTRMYAAVHADSYQAGVPTRSALAGMVVGVETNGEVLYVHPHNGLIENPRAGKAMRLIRPTNAGLEDIYFRHRGEDRVSRLEVAGKLTLTDKDELTGSLRLSATGAYYDPHALDSGDAQQRFAGKIAEGLLPGIETKNCNLSELSSRRLVAHVDVVSGDKTVQTLGRRDVLTINGDLLSQSAFPIPTKPEKHRLLGVALPGRFSETVDLVIDMPEGARLAAYPVGRETASGQWGHLLQEVRYDGKMLTFHREVVVDRDRLSVKQWRNLQTALAKLGTTANELFVVEEPETSQP